MNNRTLNSIVPFDNVIFCIGKAQIILLLCPNYSVFQYF